MNSLLIQAKNLKVRIQKDMMDTDDKARYGALRKALDHVSSAITHLEMAG